MENNPFEKDGKSLFGDPSPEQAGASVESQKASLAEQLLKHYWETKPFRKLRELKDNNAPLPTGDEAWRILKIFIKNPFESELPFEDQVAAAGVMDGETVDALYELARKENEE